MRKRVQKRPTEAEFIWQSEHRLKHLPSGAWWAVYSSGWPSMKDMLHARQRAPEGDVYSPEELERVVGTLIVKRFPQ
jgi:hypothetical protein